MLNRVEQFLFYFLFFAIPFQTRKILYSPGWYFNEWQSISVYATDILLSALFIFWIINSRSKLLYYVLRITYYGRNLKSLILNTKYLIQKPDFCLVLFLVAALISVKNSSDFFVGLFLWLKLVEFALFYFYLKSYAVKKFNLQKVLYALILGGVFQGIVGMAQFIKQGDLGLRLLGESVLGPDMTGVASFYVNSGLPAEALAKAGEKIMRAYGTTPHPNVLAAYLFLGIFAYYFVYLYYGFSHGHKTVSKQLDIALSVNYFLMLFGFFFTFSRVIIFLWFLGFFIRAVIIISKKQFRQSFLYNPANRVRLFKILLIGLVAIILFTALYGPEVSSRMTLSSEEEAVRLRVFYNKESLGGGLNLFGIGPGDFTPWLMEQNPNLPRYVYQPVHNIYLLLYSEVGIVGTLFLLLFISFLIKDFTAKTKLEKLYHNSFLLVTLSILFIGLFDHFLLTIQQGRLIFWLGLTILAIYDKMWE